MILIVLFQYWREHNIMNCVSILIVPYIIIVFLNKVIFEKLGFNKISDEVLLLLITSFISFFIGSMIATPNTIPIICEEDNELRYEKYNISAMANFVIILGIIGTIKLVQLILTGSFRTNFDEMEGVMGNGIVGHLLLVTYALVPILFLYWIDHKKEIKCIIAVLLIVSVTFSTFVKYSVIGIIVSIFICTTIYKKSLLKKSVLAMVSIVVIVFVANYLIGFVLRNIKVDNTFYLNHFWIYAGGSVLYDNGIFNGAVTNEQSILYRLCIFLFALPNMFIKKLDNGIGIFQHIKKPFISIGSGYGMQSNVVDALGYLFPYKHGVIEIMLYYILLFVFGFFFTRIYIKSKRNSKYFNIFVVNFLTYFVFFSFFGTFYINSAPWEILIYSAIVPCLFLKRSDIFHGVIRIPRSVHN